MYTGLILPLLRASFRDLHGSHRRWPARVEREARDGGDNLVLLKPFFIAFLRRKFVRRTAMRCRCIGCPASLYAKSLQVVAKLIVATDLVPSRSRMLFGPIKGLLERCHPHLISVSPQPQNEGAVGLIRNLQVVTTNSVK
jgi:hypothetical protein